MNIETLSKLVHSYPNGGFYFDTSGQPEGYLISMNPSWLWLWRGEKVPIRPGNIIRVQKNITTEIFQFQFKCNAETKDFYFIPYEEGENMTIEALSKLVYRSQKGHFYFNVQGQQEKYRFAVTRPKSGKSAKWQEERVQLHSSDVIQIETIKTGESQQFQFKYNKETKNYYFLKQGGNMIFCNQELESNGNGQIWSAKNGATRRTLVVISKIPFSGNVIQGKLGFLQKGNHAFIFINEGESRENYGLFLNSSYGYTLLEGEEIFGDSSAGGYGNSCSRFGIYRIGALIKAHTYKNRHTPSFSRLTETGWVSENIEDVYAQDIQDIE